MSIKAIYWAITSKVSGAIVRGPALWLSPFAGIPAAASEVKGAISTVREVRAATSKPRSSVAVSARPASRGVPLLTLAALAALGYYIYKRAR